MHCQNAALSQYFQRYLLQKAFSVFEWTLPESWDKNYFLYTLYGNGYLAVINTNKFGVIPQNCTLYGRNVFYQPDYAIITNPLFSQTVQAKIGRQCELVKLQPNYNSIMDITSYYADMLALCAEAAGVNLVNSKLAYVFASDNKAGAESFKKLFDQVNHGNPAVFVDKQLFNETGEVSWKMFNQNIGQTYILSDLLTDMRKIETMFLTMIGIPSANTDKRERLISDEVNANNTETASLCALWLENVQESFKKVNKMFDTNCAVKWRFKRGDGTVATVDSGNV